MGKRRIQPRIRTEQAECDGDIARWLGGCEGRAQLAAQCLQWEGSPTELYDLLTVRVGKRVSRSGAWPKSIQFFTNELRRIMPQLRVHGIGVAFDRTREGRRVEIVTAEIAALVGYL